MSNSPTPDNLADRWLHIANDAPAPGNLYAEGRRDALRDCAEQLKLACATLPGVRAYEIIKAAGLPMGTRVYEDIYQTPSYADGRRWYVNRSDRIRLSLDEIREVK